ncbi:MAG TPA: TIGR03617 family F420-dependent LLM class oxidoreductase [Mycobacteriales bacterium]|nr:TIGR03617 family F420-dependent LLM class oxidoreductase [Mycobacteriales bacterium]
MKVDAQLPLGAELNPGPVAVAAEVAGYDAIWTSEVKHEPFVTLALAATATERLAVGSAVALAFVRNPMSTAVAANHLQELSGGRLLLGLGSQVRAHVTRRFSMPWSQPAARMREYIMAMREIWACWQTGRPLRFEGDFYSHTLMTPFFDPGPNPYGAPRVLLAGVGPLMTAIAGEVADGFLCHGFTTERFLREVTIPALQAGRERVGRDLTDFDVSGLPLIATGDTEVAMQAAVRAVRGQIAFYGSTPAYRPVLDLHGWGELGERLHQMSRDGAWAEMSDCIDDEVLNAFAVVAEPAAVAPELLRRYGDAMTRMTFYTPYEIDAELAATIADAVRRAPTAVDSGVSDS